MRDFGTTKYCKKCKKEIVGDNEVVTISEADQYCECNMGCKITVGNGRNAEVYKVPEYIAFSIMNLMEYHSDKKKYCSTENSSDICPLCNGTGYKKGGIKVDYSE